MRSLAAIPILCLALFGCGYTFVAADAVPDEVRTVFIDRVEVGEGDPLLADAVTRELRRIVRSRGRFRLVESAAAADAVLSVSVTTDRTRAVAFDEFDQVLDYQTTLAADVRLESAGGDLLWSHKDVSSSRGHAAVPGAVVASSSSYQGGERTEAADLMSAK